LIVICTLQLICFTLIQEKLKKKLLVLWTVDEVCSWLETIGLEQYAETFRVNAIDGAELSNMTSEILVNDIKIGMYLTVVDLRGESTTFRLLFSNSKCSKMQLAIF
jgi:hypothetical protein